MNSTNTPMEQSRFGNIITSWLIALGIAAAFFAAIAPTLTWMEFTSGSENIVVATAMETRRDGNWLVPTLQGGPRIAKPPLAGWITALSIRPSTIDAINSPDLKTRQNGYLSLNWDTRWPNMVLGCLMLSAVFALGNVTGGRGVGVLAAFICGTTYAWLRFGRLTTTDVPLGLFVVLTNVYLAVALLHGRRWLGCIGAGACVGMAFFSKGPVALFESVAPALVFALWRWRAGIAPPLPDAPRVSWVKSILVGFAVALAIALPWFVFVIIKLSHELGFAWLIAFWSSEVTGVGASNLEGNPWYSHLDIFLMILPWPIFFVGGMIPAVRRIIWPKSPEREDERPTSGAALVLLFMMVWVPIIIISISRDRKERFLFPMFGAASVLVAHSVYVHLRRLAQHIEFERIGAIAQWLLVVGIIIAAPIAGATSLKTTDGQLWFTWNVAICSIATGIAAIAICLLIYRRWQMMIAVATGLAMLGANTLLLSGYVRSNDGVAEMRPLAERIWTYRPDAILLSYTPQRSSQRDLGIYMNRNFYEIPALPESPSPNALVITMESRKYPPLPMPDLWKEVESLRYKSHLHTWKVWELSNNPR